MQKALIPILEIQELDMQLIQLMRMKKAREKELKHIRSMKGDLKNQVTSKEREIHHLETEKRLLEGEIDGLGDKLKKLEGQQTSIKKVEEFNALSKEMAQAEREKHTKEQNLSNMIDTINQEEDLLTSLKESLESTEKSSALLEDEIYESIQKINDEGSSIKTQRDALVGNADPEVFGVYERLLKNKKDRVIVPIENRCCSGCHIMLTAQDENLVRKGERLTFCEHCSRIHYWPESEILEESEVTPKRRRRRSTTNA